MLLGFHHITALAGDPQCNLDFYTGFLGLRPVKRTVNFDDPTTHHFYFGDATATPGTILTFFPWPTAPPGLTGTGQASSVTFAVPRNLLRQWMSHPAAARETRFGEELITLRDPEGLAIELVASDTGLRLHSITVCESAAEPTAAFLTGTLGFHLVAKEGPRARYQLANSFLDIVETPGAERGKMSRGIVHHLAWRVENEAAQLEWRSKLISAGLRVSPVLDRQYFRSIYFREPGGVLFEIATDGPGFLTDESADNLGKSLKLPPWLEPVRESIERRLPPITYVT